LREVFPMADVSTLAKKTREASFFLQHMRGQERLAFGDRERFDFYLSAFLSAARSVLLRLEEPRGPFGWLFGTWRTRVWNRSLGRAERRAANRLIEFFRVDRNLEVHESGSTRAVKSVETPVSDFYSDDSGTLQTFRPPGAPPSSVVLPHFTFTIDGAERGIVEASTKYVSLLERMVAKFKADHP